MQCIHGNEVKVIIDTNGKYNLSDLMHYNEEREYLPAYLTDKDGHIKIEGCDKCKMVKYEVK